MELKLEKGHRQRWKQRKHSSQTRQSIHSTKVSQPPTHAVLLPWCGSMCGGLVCSFAPSHSFSFLCAAANDEETHRARRARIRARTATVDDYQAEIAAQECEVAAAVEEKEEIDSKLEASETRQAEYEKELEECKEKLAAERSPAAIVKLERKKEGLEVDIVLQTIKQRSLRKQKDMLATRITEFDALKQRLGAGHERAARPCLSLPVTRLVLCANAYCAAFKRLLSLFFFCSGFEQSHTHTHTHTHTRTLAHASHTLFPFLALLFPLPSPLPNPNHLHRASVSQQRGQRDGRLSRAWTTSTARRAMWVQLALSLPKRLTCPLFPFSFVPLFRP